MLAHEPASMDVGNGIDRWRIQRRWEDGRHTRVMGEEREGEMRDVKDTRPHEGSVKR